MGYKKLPALALAAALFTPSAMAEEPQKPELQPVDPLLVGQVQMCVLAGVEDTSAQVKRITTQDETHVYTVSLEEGDGEDGKELTNLRLFQRFDPESLSAGGTELLDENIDGVVDRFAVPGSFLKPVSESSDPSKIQQDYQEMLKNIAAACRTDEPEEDGDREEQKKEKNGSYQTKVAAKN